MWDCSVRPKLDGQHGRGPSRGWCDVEMFLSGTVYRIEVFDQTLVFSPCRWTSRRPAGLTARSARSTNPTKSPSTRRGRTPSTHRVNISTLCYVSWMICIWTVTSSAGKRRYDRKQSGYGGQTKPIFRKKVTVRDGWWLLCSNVYWLICCVHRLRPQRKSCWGWSVWSPTVDPRECWPSRDASTSSWVVTRRER